MEKNLYSLPDLAQLMQAGVRRYNHWLASGCLVARVFPGCFKVTALSSSPPFTLATRSIRVRPSVAPRNTRAPGSESHSVAQFTQIRRLPCARLGPVQFSLCLILNCHLPPFFYTCAGIGTDRTKHNTTYKTQTIP
jgi:hypothetical protein